ncbi:hypothetical protein XH96_03415 [Bradyrhizobium sp. CCBAU 51765]|nr:hypothetical protein XH96_03415 [Bradyrhizobium sp. CCBAU 51765]
MQNREATPESIRDDVATFAADLGASMPTFVPLRVPSDAAEIGREQNMFRQCRAYKGSPLFGRAISLADDLYAVAEFHCVVATSVGLIDVTPGNAGEHRILFAAYPTIADDGGGLHRPNIRARLYGTWAKKAQLDANISAATERDAATAARNGVTLRQLLLSRMARTPFEARIDDYLRAEGKLEAMFVAAHDGAGGLDPTRLAGLRAESDRVDRKRNDVYAEADRLKAANAHQPR